MKKILFVFCIFFFFNNGFAHKQHVHQYLTIEAYKLLKLHIGYDIPALQARLGGTTSWYVGDRPWQRWYITTGAWREDEEDIVYGYSKGNPPTITGVPGVLNEIIAAFGGLNPDGFVSSTHFWYADNGDNISTTINAAIDLGVFGTHTFNFTVPNAYQKLVKFAQPNRSWILKYFDGSTAHQSTFTKAGGGSVTITWYNQLGFEYNSIKELYQTGRAWIVGYYDVTGQWINHNLNPNLPYEVILGTGWRDAFVWEILGRMCHLLQDMSVPAHANIDPHGSNPGLKDDSYENYFGYDYYWNANNVYSQIGSIIDPYQGTNPLHFLMYTTNQISNHFGSNGPHMNQPNDIFIGNPRSEELSYLNSLNLSLYGPPTTMTDPLTPAQILNIRDKMFPQVIRATAGLLYWFAVETGLIPPPPPVPPIISHFTQNPDPICKGTTGTVTAHLSQGDPNQCAWVWEAIDKPAGVVVTGQGQYCSVYYPYSREVFNPMAPVFQLKCTASISGLPSSTKYYTPRGNAYCPGCPTLAIETDGNLVDENTLLITSLSNPGKDVTDYYLINTPLTPVDNRINLTIHEPQTEHTWFDNIALLETIANPGEKIVVNDEGQVINYKGVLPARILLNGETDITQNLLEMDSLVVSLSEGDKLTIIRNTIEGGDGDVVLGGEEPPVFKDRPALTFNVIKEIKTEKNSTDETVSTEKVPVLDFYFRPHKSIISKRLRNLPSGTIEVAVNKEITLDYFVFVSDLRTARTRELPLFSAIHNTNGDIKSKLRGIDLNYAEMYPTERIDLSFSTNTNNGNRAYILKTVGKYQTDTLFTGKQNNLGKSIDQPMVPLENKLFDNYPNPFNPTTTIKYSIKEAGLVQIKVYDVLGAEVAILVNEVKEAGYHSIEFNATAVASQLPSGVYIYIIQVNNFFNSKKMILIK